MNVAFEYLRQFKKVSDEAEELVMKVLIGIGDSWTQGEGGYPDDIWKANNGRMWKKLSESLHLIPIEQENSWVNKLAQHLNYTPVNLGQRAIGNRGAVRSLYLNDVSQYTGGTVALMLSGFDRFDLFQKQWKDDHYKFETLWPHMEHKDMTVQEQIEKDLPPLPIDVLNVPKDSQALTRAGRSYSKAAIELHNLQKRRGEVLKEYEERMKTVAPTIQELVVLHDRINQIIMELAQG